jgi:hypothetical protein
MADNPTRLTRIMTFITPYASFLGLIYIIHNVVDWATFENGQAKIYTLGKEVIRFLSDPHTPSIQKVFIAFYFIIQCLFLLCMIVYLILWLAKSHPHVRHIILVPVIPIFAVLILLCRISGLLFVVRSRSFSTLYNELSLGFHSHQLAYTVFIWIFNIAFIYWFFISGAQIEDLGFGILQIVASLEWFVWSVQNIFQAMNR